MIFRCRGDPRRGPRSTGWVAHIVHQCLRSYIRYQASGIGHRYGISKIQHGRSKPSPEGKTINLILFDIWILLFGT